MKVSGLVVVAVLALLGTWAPPAAAKDVPARVSVVGPNGQALPNVHLLATRGRMDERRVFDARANVLATSDAAGVIDLNRLGLDPTRRYLVWSPGYAPALLPQTGRPASMRLLKGRTTAGSLRLYRGKKGAELDLVAIPRSPHADLVHATRTDVGGRYRFDSLHAGRWDVYLRHGRGRLQRIAEVLAGETAGEARLGRATSIRGRILDGDGTHRKPAGGVNVELLPLAGARAEGATSAELSTAADGTFLAEGLQPGIYVAQMRSLDWTFAPRGPYVEVQAERARDLPTWFAVRRQPVTGTVLDEHDRPLSGVSIRLVPDPTRPLPAGASAEGTQTVTSDGLGRFQIPRVAPGPGYRLVASAVGRSAWTSNAFDVDHGEATELKPFHLRRGWRIALRVRTLDGMPVARARVVATAARRPTALDDPFWSDTVRRGQTDKEGRLQLVDLPEDDVLIRVEAQGHETGSLVVDYPRVSDWRKADITLRSGTELVGQITVPPEGVAGPFVVTAFRRDGAASLRVNAAPDGAFKFPSLSDTAYDIVVSREADGRHQRLATVENVLPGVEEHLLIRLPALRAVRGSVDDLVFAGKAVFVVVEARRYDPDRSQYRWRTEARVLLKPVGTLATFAVEHLAPGLYAVRVVQGLVDTNTMTVRLADADVDGLELHMPAGARVAGAVLLEGGGPLLGARIRLTRLHGEDEAPVPLAGGLERRSDERGDFMADGLAPGLWRISAEAPDLAPAVRTVRLREGEVLVLDDLTLGAGGALEGRVEDAGGRALDSVVIHARRFEGDGVPLILRTDGEGRFRAPSLRAGTWLLRVEAETVAGGPWIEAVVEVQVGRTAEVLFAAGEDGSIAGTLRRRGRPVAGAVVDLIHNPEAGSAPLRRYRSSTGIDGRFKVERLEAGRYTIQVQSGAWRTTHGMDLRAGDKLELDLEAFEGRLRGDVVTRDGRPVAGALIVATPLDEDGRPLVGLGYLGEGRTGPLGTFLLRGLPPGTYALAVSAPGHPPGRYERAEADLPGADFAVRVVLGRGGDIDLSVRDEQERGITGAAVWLEDQDGVPFHRQAYLTGAAGRLRIDGVPPGVVRLRVHARGFGRPSLQTLTVEEGHIQPVDVVLGAAGSILLTVTGETVDPRPRARIDIVRAKTGEILASRRPLSPIRLAAPWGHVPRTGVARFEDLEAGHYLVRISAGRLYEPAEVAVEVRAGLAAEIRVMLAPR